MCFVFHVEFWSEVVDIAILQIAHCRCAHVRWTCIPTILFGLACLCSWGYIFGVYASALSLRCHAMIACFQLTWFVFAVGSFIFGVYAFALSLRSHVMITCSQLICFVFAVGVPSLVHRLPRYPSDYTLWLRVSNCSASSWQLEVSSLVYMLSRYPSDHTLWVRVPSWAASSLQLEVSSLVYMRWRYSSDHTLWVCAPNWAASSLQSGFH